MTTVLLADDHPIMLAGVDRLLSGSGHEVIARVTDGAQVLAEIASKQPDIAILDVAMPGLTGIAILQRLRERGEGVKVVLLTADLDGGDLLEAMRCKVDGVVLKHGGERSLLACLDRVATGGRWIPQELLARQSQLREALENDPLRALTTKEKEIARLIAEGLRNRSIAGELALSEGTVKVYLSRIYEKLAISSRTELAAVVNRTPHSGR